MGYKHWANVGEKHDLCFVTTTIEEFIPILAVPHNAQIILSNLDFYRKKHGFLLHAYVVMPDHIHLLLQLMGRIDLTRLMADFKRYTAKQMLEWCGVLPGGDTWRDSRQDWLEVFARRGAADGERYSVWQRSFRSVPVSGRKDVLVKLEYIHNNPVRKQLVVSPDDWPYSSAAAYEGGVAAIRADLLEP